MQTNGVSHQAHLTSYSEQILGGRKWHGKEGWGPLPQDGADLPHTHTTRARAPGGAGV